MTLQTFIFNRRLVDDQTIYVQANSKEEAWARARANECDQTGDARIVKVTLRLLKGEPPPSSEPSP
jgi:hypothetical protein